jgi:hypothetical protein
MMEAMQEEKGVEKNWVYDNITITQTYKHQVPLSFASERERDLG